jgi:hypothetical protein
MMRATIQYRQWRLLKPENFREHALKPSLTEVVQDWHLKTLPLHFRRKAISDYGYKPRNQKYEGKKQKLKGHTDPLVFSGTARRQALASIKISGTARRARGTLNVPSYIYKYHKETQVDKAAEMTATNQREALEMAKSLDQKIGQRIDGDRSVETKHI